jgi:hypothetical protein
VQAKAYRQPVSETAQDRHDRIGIEVADCMKALGYGHSRLLQQRCYIFMSALGQSGHSTEGRPVTRLRPAYSHKPQLWEVRSSGTMILGGRAQKTGRPN